MAIVVTKGAPGTADEDRNSADSGAPAGTPPPQTGQSGFVGGGSGQGATTTAKSQSSTPTAGNYTNLQSYLTANGGQGGAGDITSKAAENVIDEGGRQATAATQNFGNEGNHQIDNALNAVGVDQGTLGKINGNAASVDENALANARNNGVGMSVKSGTFNPGTVSYKGPGADASGNVTGLTGAASDAQGKAAGFFGSGGTLSGLVDQAHNGQTGANALLKQAYNPAGYTRGEQGLDAALTVDSGRLTNDASGVLNGAQSNYNNLLGQLGSRAQSGSQIAAQTNQVYKDAQSHADEVTNNTNNRYSSAVSQYGADQAAAAKAAADKAAADKAAADKAAADQAAAAQQQAQPSPAQAPAPPSNSDNSGFGKIKSGISNSLNEAQAQGAGLLTAAGASTPGSQGDGGQQNVLGQAQQTVANTVAQAATPAKNTVNKVFGTHFAHGGSVPSYGELLKRLGK